MSFQKNGTMFLRTSYPPKKVSYPQMFRNVEKAVDKCELLVDSLFVEGVKSGSKSL